MKNLCIILLILTLSHVTTDQSFGQNLMKAFLKNGIVMNRCTMDLVRVFTSLKERWAIQMLDSFGKPGSGILKANVVWLGSSYECEKVKAPASKNARPFQGKFCTIVSKSTSVQGMDIPITSCVPDSCDRITILKIYQTLFSLIADSLEPIMKNKTEINIIDVDCEYEESNFGVGTAITLFVLGVLIAPTAYMTLLEYFGSDSSLLNHKFADILSCFSGRNNARSILKQESTAGEFSFINGVRVLSMIWLVTGHTYSKIGGRMRNLLSMIPSLNNMPTDILSNSFAVDVFYFMSSFLFVYLFRRREENILNSKNMLGLLIQRYIRTWLPSLLCIAVVSYVAILTGYKPIVKTDFTMKQTWKWWHFYLVISNAFHYLNFGWLWYIAVDFQLFIFCLVALYIIQKSRRFGFGFVVALLLIACVTHTYHAYQLDAKLIVDVLKAFEEVDLSQAKVGTLSSVNMEFPFLQQNPYARPVTYWIGFLYGWYMSRKTTQKATGGRPYKRVFLLILANIFFLHNLFYARLIERGRLANAFHLTTNRLSSGAGLILLFHICINYPKSIPNRVLAWRLWRPLGKITFSVFLYHVPLMFFINYGGQQLPVFSHKRQLSMGLGYIIASYTFGFLSSILIEWPLGNLGKLILADKKDKEE